MNSARLTIALPLVALLLAAGCNGRSYQASSPVIGPVPPRVSVSEVDQNTRASNTRNSKSVRGKGGEIQTVSSTDPDTQPLGMTDVIADVNGEPILAHEVLDRYAPQLAKAKPKMKPEQFRIAQLELIKKDLPNLIEQTLMVDSVKQDMKPEQLTSVETQMDKFFEGEVERLMKVTNTGSPTELEAVLQSQGLSLATLRKQFADRQLAGQFMRMKMGAEPTASREEMRARYEQDIESFTEAEQIKWQQIDISYEAHGGADEAEAAAQKLLRQIRSGAISFDEAAHTKSDSALASKGGHWDWTQPSSLADADVREALLSLELNEVSDVIPTKTACILVMPTGRHEARVIPFNEVQKELQDRIVKDKKIAIGEAVLKELMAEAVIHTILDDADAG
jgi:peptidyl-prolyl cis-trans isomerase SurA